MTSGKDGEKKVVVPLKASAVGGADLSRFRIECFFGDDAFEPLLEEAQISFPVRRRQGGAQVLFRRQQNVFGGRSRHGFNGS